jgi:hypothetical protein
MAVDLIWHGEPDNTPLKEWLVDGLLPKTGLALVAGQWGTFKTFVVLDLSASIMTQMPFAGRAVHRQGGVLFIAVEGQNEVRVRVEGIAIGKVARVEASNGALPISSDRMPFTWTRRCPRLADLGAIVELREIVRAAAEGMKEKFGLPLALIVIDALMPAAMFRDANDASESYRALTPLITIAQEFELLVAVVDHFGKDVSTGTRNSSAKEDAADTILALLADRALAGTITNTRLATRKVRGGENGEELPFTTHKVEVPINGGGTTVETLVIDWTPAEPGEAPLKTRHWPKSLVVFKRVLDKTLGDSGKRMRPFFDGPEVLAVNRDAARAEFLKTYSADSQRAKATAFNRSVKRALEESLMCSREIDGEEYYWRLDVKQREGGSERQPF